MHVQIKRICAPTDFSECGDYAVKCAAALARQFGADLHLVHVIQDVATKLKHPDFTGQSVSVVEFLQSLERGATEYLARLAAKKEWSDLNVERVYLHGAPSEQIVRYAVDNRIDLVVVGTHGRTGLSQLLLGSVAERVVRHSSCPVLTVRHPIERGFLRTDEMSKLPGVE